MVIKKETSNFHDGKLYSRYEFYNISQNNYELILDSLEYYLHVSSDLNKNDELIKNIKNLKELMVKGK